ncbi:hypothetical protein AVEN_43734-1 [Araneus ventricosus]|uniref:Transposable element Tc3 transposase n=1 Tax=Araneus ventricosus TaxID=182803 RepID=A0A4Y2BW67_ARAVE|nr:hypothetical protein AVEN_43734-1 [Araneus ventricosus]
MVPTRGAPPHKISSVQQYIRDTFQKQFIGYGGCVEWPPHSHDLNPLDFFLWGYIKQRVYATLPPTLQEHRNLITDACASVSPAMLYNVQRGVQSRVQMCIVAEGHHFEHGRLISRIFGRCSFVQRDKTNDGTLPHWDIDVGAFLDTTFPNRWVGLGGPIAWSPRSTDVTRLDFFGGRELRHRQSILKGDP